MSSNRLDLVFKLIALASISTFVHGLTQPKLTPIQETGHNSIDDGFLTLVGDQEVCNAMVVNNDTEKIVCVCNESSCPGLKISWPDKSGQVYVVTSSMAGERLVTRELDDLLQSVEMPTDSVEVHLNSTRQRIEGWGGAFTDSAGIQFASLSKKLAIKLIGDYFGEEGLLYNFGRVPIGGADFSTHAYSYDDTPEPDFELKNWTLVKEDLEYKIPYIKLAAEMTQKAGGHLKLMGSPWSPPKWMKDNNDLVRGRLIDEDHVYKSYTNYLMKFYEAYEEHGLEFWGATVQNEPIAAYLPLYTFNGLQMGNDQMIKFISKYLGPALHERGLTKDKFKLIIGDDSLGFINLQVPMIMADPEVRKYVAGLAFHWYTSGFLVPYDSLTRLYEPIKKDLEFLLMTEACEGSRPRQAKVDLGSWERGESYASDIIEDLLRYTGGWIDWNLALNLEGGPNWVNNFVDSPILVNAEKNEYYKQPTYYALGHFSRYMRPGALVLKTHEATSISNLINGKVSTVAALDKGSNTVIVNILNKLEKPRSIEISIIGAPTGRDKFTVEVDKRTITTVLIKI